MIIGYNDVRYGIIMIFMSVVLRYDYLLAACWVAHSRTSLYVYCFIRVILGVYGHLVSAH